MKKSDVYSPISCRRAAMDGMDKLRDRSRLQHLCRGKNECIQRLFSLSFDTLRDVVVFHEYAEQRDPVLGSVIVYHFCACFACLACST